MSRVRGYTRALRTRSPRWLVRFLRSVITGWGMATARWRMQPAFIVIGAQRAGTTTLYRLLSEHPDVVRPTVSKGIGYFDDSYGRGERWYRSHFPLAAGRARGKVTFESSGYYLFHPLAAERIARDLPGVRVVAMLRDPVERAYSAHQHELARGFDDQPFEQAVALEESRLAGEVERLRADPAYTSFAHRHHAYLAKSRYSEQLQKYVDELGRDRVYIVDADRFFAAPEQEFAALQEWLGLSPWSPAKVEKWNERRRDPISPPLRARLMRHFEPYDEELTRLVGRRPSWRENRLDDAVEG